MTSLNSLLQKLLKLKFTNIKDIEEITVPIEAFGTTFEQTRLIVHAEPYKRLQGLCPHCMHKCAKNGYKQEKESTWRASNLIGIPVYIKYRPHRIFCPVHGSVNEYICWQDGNSRFTPAFNDEVAWLACRMSKLDISMFLGISWSTVGNCIQAAHKRLEKNDVSDRLHDNVRRICVDETSYKKGHSYMTVVTDMDKNKVIWVHKGHGYEVFSEFCNQLTEDDRNNIEIVAGDGARWIDSCMKFFPNAIRCIDFFHVAQWANKALDDIRIALIAEAKRTYNKLLAKYIQAEKQLAETEEKMKKQCLDAQKELSTMPHRGRPSKRKQELLAFIAEYKNSQKQSKGKDLPRSVGRPKKQQLSEEHEKILKEYKDEINDFKGAKFALGHNPEDCTAGQLEKIDLIKNNYPELFRAYQLKESLRIILHMRDRNQANIELSNWFKDAQESNLKPMQELADKIKNRHLTNILNAIEYQANSAKSEAMNTTIKGLIKVARGFRNLENLFALIYLKCSDIVIPLSNRPTPSEEYLAKKRERANELRRAREEKRRKALATRAA